jgi:uncharacterized protein (DUF305 family)
MMLVSFISMYVLMYSMVDRFDNVVNSLNQVYMAAVMAAPMVLIELWLMGGMYPNRRLNAIVAIAALVVGIASLVAIRRQAGISDRQFLRSMIPHHAGAILMCQQASFRDPQVQALCGPIVSSQTEEIAIMKRLLDNGAGQ